MLTLVLPAEGDYEALELHLEHSLHSISKWESIHRKAFYGKEPMTNAETISYVQQMLLVDVPIVEWVERLKLEHYEAVTEYINADRTATWFRESQSKRGPSNEVTTSELIYYWMISFQIPFETDRWHISRLMALIKICGIKQTKPKKMDKRSLHEEYRRINAERLERLGTSG